MGRLLRKAQRKKNLKQIKILEELIAILDRDELSVEEKREISLGIIDKEIAELSAKIEASNHKGKAWDFSKEKSMTVFAEDEDILLRACCDKDKPYLVQIKRENADNPAIYDEPKMCESACEWIYDEAAFGCAVIRKSDGAFLGYVSIKNSRQNLWEIAVEFIEEYCHKGYGSKAVRLFVDEISKVSGKKQFQALVETDNIPSQKLMEKLGAKLIDIYLFAFDSEEEAEEFEEEHLGEITERMEELARQIGVEARQMLSHVLDYRLFVETEGCE